MDAAVQLRVKSVCINCQSSEGQRRKRYNVRDTLCEQSSPLDAFFANYQLLCLRRNRCATSVRNALLGVFFRHKLMWTCLFKFSV